MHADTENNLPPSNTDWKPESLGNGILLKKKTWFSFFGLFLSFFYFSSADKTTGVQLRWAGRTPLPGAHTRKRCLHFCSLHSHPQRRRAEILPRMKETPEEHSCIPASHSPLHQKGGFCGLSTIFTSCAIKRLYFFFLRNSTEEKGQWGTKDVTLEAGRVWGRNLSTRLCLQCSYGSHFGFPDAFPCCFWNQAIDISQKRENHIQGCLLLSPF